jgi:predicted short-subunit dehydrogenase-like oxidoreductase (DUF2520 family)
VPVRLHSRHPRPAPAGIPITAGSPLPSWLPDVDIVLLAVPDAAVPGVATLLAGSAAIAGRHVVLHLSGVLDARSLSALSGSGAGLGSFHPLLSFTDPASAPLKLAAAVAAVEGDERSRAAAFLLASRVGLTPFVIRAEDKPLYHAAAVFGANFLVTIAAVGRRLFEQAGVPPEHAARGLATLMSGVLENIARAGPASALTGPVQRGDAETLRRNLAALGSDDAVLYRALSRATLDIADLTTEQRRAVEEAIHERREK